MQNQMNYNDYSGLFRGRAYVDPLKCRTPEQYPYSYDEFYIWRDVGITSYGEGQKLYAEYSDHLAKRDYDHYEKTLKGLNFETIGKMKLSDRLSAYFSKKVEVKALIKGCNVSNGYPYYVFVLKVLDADKL